MTPFKRQKGSGGTLMPLTSGFQGAVLQLSQPVESSFNLDEGKSDNVADVADQQEPQYVVGWTNDDVAPDFPSHSRQFVPPRFNLFLQRLPPKARGRPGRL